eukprot:m51a1_g8101 putative myosin light chain kinase (415) ;mRNA; f:84027-86682
MRARGPLGMFAIEARNVETRGRGVDIYVKAKSSNGQQFQTSKVPSSAPRWGDDFVFTFPKKKRPTVALKLVEKGIITDDVLAEISVPLESVNEAGEKIWVLDKKKGRGELRVLVTLPGGSGADDKMSLEAKYTIGKEIGRGGFSVVYDGVEKATQKKVAIKVIDKKKQEADQLKLLEREIDIMKRLKHPNIVELYEVFNTSQYIYMVMEYISGGELYDQIVARGSFTEADAANLIKQVLSATEHMHEHGIAHRDLKPENLLLSTARADAVKVADFGLSKDFNTASQMSTCCGSPSYVAPEVLGGGVYSNACDVWSIGVILYVLLSGYLPFFGDTQEELFDKIMSGTYSFSNKCWEDISPEAKDLLSKMLVVSPQTRITIAACLAHPWVTGRNARTKNLRSLESLRDLRAPAKHR